MEKLELKASIEALIYNWLKFDTETIDIASGMREETNFYVNERTNGFRVVMEYPIGYNDVQGGDIGEIVIKRCKSSRRICSKKTLLINFLEEHWSTLIFSEENH